MDLKNIVRQIKTLPTLPTILWRLNDLLRDPRTTMADIAVVISKDQTCTARVLKLVNSAFYGFPRKISNLSQAITLIGINPLRNLLLATSVFELIPSKESKSIFKREQFWHHSIACAVSAKAIGQQIRMVNLEELFVAGLLHDIGKVILDYLIHDSFIASVELAHSENILIKEAEKQLLGFDHATIGGLLAEQWKLPPKLCACISYHHDPLIHPGNDFRKEISIIHLADILIRIKNLGQGGDNCIPQMEMKAWDSLKLSLSALEPIMEKIDVDYEESVSILMNPIFMNKSETHPRYAYQR